MIYPDFFGSVSIFAISPRVIWAWIGSVAPSIYKDSTKICKYPATVFPVMIFQLTYEIILILLR